MRPRRVLLTEELYQKLIQAFMGCLNLRQSVVEKTLDNFLTDLLEHLASEPQVLKGLLSNQ